MKNIKIKALIIGLIAFFILELFAIDSMGQLNFNSRRLSSDTLRARSTSQGGVNGKLNLPYNWAGTFPTIAVNDTLLVDWINNFTGGVILTDGSGIELIGDSINLGGDITSTLTWDVLTGNEVNFAFPHGGLTRFIVNHGTSTLFSLNADDFLWESSGGGTPEFTINSLHTGNGGGIHFNIGGGPFNNFIITDSRALTKGIEYDSDYSSGFQDHTLIDKLYGDNNFWLINSDFTVGDNRTITFDTLSFIGVGGLVLGNGTEGELSIQNNGVDDDILMLNNGTGDSDLFIQKTLGTGDLILTHGAGGIMRLETTVGSTGIDTKLFDGSYTLNLNAGCDGATIIDARPATVGLEYNADYSSDFTVRSLTDKGYSDSYFTGSLTDGTPTDAEIDAILGTPASVGSGYKAVIKDSDGTGLIYAIFTDGSGWYWNITTLAL